jgi:hypothetical protein
VGIGERITPSAAIRFRKLMQTGPMRRSIDDYPFEESDYPPDYEGDELTPISWAVGISDDYADAEPRVMLTVEEVGRPGQGLVGHLSPDIARRLRAAIRDALAEIGEEPGR